MSKKHLAALFISTLAPWTVGNALLALLPVYVARLGADPGFIGNYLALAFFMLAAGTIGAGSLSNKFGRRKVFIIAAGVINLPSTFLMGHISQLWQLVILTCIVWFCGGMIVSMGAILAGMFARPSERGKVFGILALNVGLGALLGGMLSGNIVDRWGFPALFILVSPIWLVQALVSCFLEDTVAAVQTPAVDVSLPKMSLGYTFYLLAAANVIASITNFVAGLGRTLQMDKMAFSSSEISSVVAISGAISLPFPFLVGWLSDRIGRYRLLMLCFLSMAIGMCVLIVSESLWQFWASAILMAMSGTAGAVGTALVTDLVSRESLSVALARFGATGWIGGVIGYLGTGHAILLFGMSTTLILGIFFSVFAIILVVWMQHIKQKSPLVVPLPAAYTDSA